MWWAGRTRHAPAVWAALLCAVLAMAGCQTSSFSGAWQNLGPDDGSVVLSLTVDAASHQVLYAGTSSGLVYRGAARSTALIARRGIPQDAAVSALATDAGQPGAVYAGTSRGLFFSGDYGDHWQSRSQGLPADDGIGALAVRPSVGSSAPEIFAGTQQHGVYVSHDRGATWGASDSGLPDRANVYGLTYEPTTTTLYAALVAGGIYRSRDAGQTWVARSDGLVASGDTFVVLALAHSGAPAGQPTLYAGTSKGLFASGDGGQTWQLRGAGMGVGSGAPRVLALAPDPTEPNALYAGTDDSVYHSTDGGQHWAQVAPGITHHVAAVAALPDAHGHPVVFAGAGSALRYPAGPTASLLSQILAGIVLMVVLGAVIQSYRRLLGNARRGHAPGPATPGGELAPSRFAPPPNDSGERYGLDAGGNGRRPDQAD